MNYFYIRTAKKKSILFWGKMSSKKRSISRKKWWISYSTGIPLSLCITQRLLVEKAFWPCSWRKGRVKPGAHRKITQRWGRRRQSCQNSCPGNRPLLITPHWSWKLCSHQPLLHPLPPVRKQVNHLLQKLPPSQPSAVFPSASTLFFLAHVGCTVPAKCTVPHNGRSMLWHDPHWW